MSSGVSSQDSNDWGFKAELEIPTQVLERVKTTASVQDIVASLGAVLQSTNSTQARQEIKVLTGLLEDLINKIDHIGEQLGETSSALLEKVSRLDAMLDPFSLIPKLKKELNHWLRFTEPFDTPQGPGKSRAAVEGLEAALRSGPTGPQARLAMKRILCQLSQTLNPDLVGEDLRRVVDLAL